MKRKILKWWFRTPDPTSLKQALVTLEPLGLDWYESNNDYKDDYISTDISDGVHLALVKIGLRGFDAKLYVQDGSDSGLNPRIADAKKRLLENVLPLLKAEEIQEMEPEEQ